MGTQLHDFSPWVLPNGLFWLVNVPDSAVQVTDDTLTIHLVDVPTVDALSFPPPPQAVPGISPIQLVPATVSFDVTYTKTGNERKIKPASHDPLSPLAWAGEMWDATNSGTFALSYNDGSFSASGSFDSSGNFGEMGTERNGVFVKGGKGGAGSATAAQVPAVASTQANQPAGKAGASPAERTVLLKGRVPVKVKN